MWIRNAGISAALFWALFLHFGLFAMAASSDLEKDLVFFDTHSSANIGTGQETSTPFGSQVDLSVLSELVILDGVVNDSASRDDLIESSKSTLTEKTLVFDSPREMIKPEIPLTTLAELVPAHNPAELLSDIVTNQELSTTRQTEMPLVAAKQVAPLHTLADLILWSEAGDPILQGDLVPTERTQEQRRALAPLDAIEKSVSIPDLAELTAVTGDSHMLTDSGSPAFAMPRVLPSRPFSTGNEAIPPQGDPDISRAQVSARRLETFCQEGELGKALRMYNSMPGFGNNGWVNKYRADSANLLVLNLCRTGKFDIARQLYDRLPGFIAGENAMVGKARAALNLTAFYVKEDESDKGYALFSDLKGMSGIDETYPDLFKLTARMIPYLDNAGFSDKAAAAHEYILSLVTTRETAQLYAECVPSLTKYLLARPGSLLADPGQRSRQLMMEKIFDALSMLGGEDEIARARVGAAQALAIYYEKTANAEKAAEMHKYVEAAEHSALWEDSP